MSSVEGFLKFIDDSPTPFHAVESIKRLLGFEVLDERDKWNLVPGGRYVVTRNGSSLVAFIVGESGLIRESGFRIVGAHTDSPNLRLKPRPDYSSHGYLQLGVEPYGGPLLASWLNRDLFIAGRLVLQSEEDLSISMSLVEMGDIIISIPQLAIHLNRDVNETGLVVNKQNHLPPIIGLGKEVACKIEERGAHGKKIIGFSLMLSDSQPSRTGGLNGEFIFAPRLDNLSSCHAGAVALAQAQTGEQTCVLVCYDNEEVGSQTAQGAQSSFLRDTLERIASGCNRRNTRDDFGRAIANSFCVSVDMAHAFNPNYPDKHDPRHMPIIGGGPVLKTNSNQRYATDDLSAALFRELCILSGVKLQDFVSRSDLACGTTIGPITAAELGMRTVDVGGPMLSMHAVREQAGVSDHIDMIKVLSAFFAHTIKL